MYQLRNITPHKSLRPYIKSIWFLDQGKENYTSLHLVPDGFPEMLFTLSGRCTTTYAKGNKESIHPMSFLGQISGTIHIETENGFQGIFVKFYPWAASSFFPEDQRQTLDRAVDITGLRSWRLISRSMLVDPLMKVEEKLRRIELEFVAWVQEIVEPPPILNILTKKILASKGMSSIGDLTSHFRCSRRTIELLFNYHLGLPPDYYNQLIRTKEISRRISEGDYISFGQLSQDFSFTDAAHFTRNFKKRTGMTPSRFKQYMDGFPIAEKEAYLRQFLHSELISAVK